MPSLNWRNAIILVFVLVTVFALLGGGFLLSVGDEPIDDTPTDGGTDITSDSTPNESTEPSSEQTTEDDDGVRNDSSDDSDRSSGSSGGGSTSSSSASSSSDRAESANVTVDLTADSPVEQLRQAVEVLQDVDTETDAQAATLNETVTAVNESAWSYRSPAYADSAATFDELAAAQRGLEQLATENVTADQQLAEASHHLFEASNASARFWTADAYATVDEHDESFSTSSERRDAHHAVGDAGDELSQADDETADVSVGAIAENETTVVELVSAHESASDHHRAGWTDADDAFDIVESSTEPTIEVAKHQPTERNGAVQIPIEATVDDVRPYAYDNASVVVENETERESAEPIDFGSSPTPNTQTFGTTFVNLENPTENKTVTVTATPEHDSDRQVSDSLTISIDDEDIHREPPAPDEYNAVTVADDASNVTVDAGGDGLAADRLEVRDETPETDGPHHAGPTVRIENETPVDTADVTIPLDDDVDPDAGNLSIYTWDQTSDSGWEPVETEIDTTNGTATATVDEFSFFSVFWVDNWHEQTSDVVTLESADEDGNETDFETIDVVFVVDESGSMSGSPISYAREGAQRFTGALLESERGGLVGFSSSASLEHDLTTDHDALNSSIDGLSSGGGTDTESGLRAGMGELETNGYDNRSQEIILLADGKSGSSSDAIAAAEDAAEADIEIHSIGLGDSIDEAELTGIANATGGDYYHVEDSEELPNAFERVAENQTGIDLEDTNGDGIPDVVAEMDLRMPTGEPGVEGEPLDLDPIALDTSGDGIRDNETVEIDYRAFEDDGETKVEARVTEATHHPARIDTTGDGLTDREQLEGWEISVIDDHRDAETLQFGPDVPEEDGLEAALEQQFRPDDPAADRLSNRHFLSDEIETEREIDAVDLFETRNVSANPLVSDTSANSLSDVEERELGTDPERADTTGDGLTDDRALELDADDPTIFTTTPPEATLLHYDQGWAGGSYEFPRYTFSYRYQIEDEVGVDEYDLRREGVSYDAEDQLGGPNSATRYTEFEHESERVLTALRGAETILIAQDVHDNQRSQSLYVQHDWVTNRYQESITTSTREAGRESGFTTGLAELPDLLRLLVNEPGEMGEALATVAVQSSDPQEDPLLEMIENLPESIHNQQDLANPHTEADDDYAATVADCTDEYGALQEPSIQDPETNACQFAIGYYEGYAGYIVLETAAGSKGVTRGVSSGEDVATSLRQADADVDTPAAIRDGSVTKTETVGQRLAADGGAPAVDYDAVRLHLRDDHGIESGGGQARALEQLDGDLRHLEELSSSEQAALGARLSKSQNPSATRAFVTELDDVDDVRYLLEETDTATTNQLVEWHANPSASRNIDPDLEANDLLHVARNGDVSETHMVIKAPDTDESLAVRWLEEGDLDEGWTHIEARHIEGKHQLDSEDATGIFPTGERVKGQEMPNTITRNDVHDVLYDAIKHGEPTQQGQKTRYYFEPVNEGYPNSGISGMRAFTFADGSIETTYPLSGGAVERWVPDLNQGQGGFVDNT